jgi:malonate transporter
MFIFEALFPIVFLAFVAWLSARTGIVSDTEIRVLEKVSFNFLIPCMLFYGTATAELPSEMNMDLLWGYYLAVLIIYLLGMLIARLRYGPGQARLGVVGMGCAYPNVTILGIPICLELLGEGAFVPMFMLIALHNLLIFSFGTIVAELKREEGRTIGAHVFRVAKELLKNPISGSLMLGMAVNFSGIDIYRPLLQAMELVSRAGIPAALMTLGAGLNRYHIRGEIPMAVVITVIKLLVLPALVWLLTGYVFSMDRLWMQTAVLLACMPVGISVYVYSIRYRCCENLAATAIVLSCVLSVLSISLFSLLLGI